MRTQHFLKVLGKGFLIKISALFRLEIFKKTIYFFLLFLSWGLLYLYNSRNKDKHDEEEFFFCIAGKEKDFSFLKGFLSFLKKFFFFVLKLIFFVLVKPYIKFLISNFFSLRLIRFPGRTGWRKFLKYNNFSQQAEQNDFSLRLIALY